ncbi:unnamed protein product [Coregonus sp. 'balchen']|nr:unnamed protein product [Coregonus sp. 'balchen']
MSAELYGLQVAIRMLESMKNSELAQELEKKCKRAVIQYELKYGLIRRHNCIYEGVPRAGQHLYRKYVYVEAQISTHGHSGFQPSPGRLPGQRDWWENIFRLRSRNGSPV